MTLRLDLAQKPAMNVCELITPLCTEANFVADFGFMDGISNPAVSGFDTDVLPGQAVVPSGVILLKRPGDTLSRPPWALDGTFMAFRKLQQRVPEFNAWTLANAVQDPARNLSQKGGAALLGARMFGRWKSGAPTDLAPFADDPALGADPTRNNDFDFSHPGEDITSNQTQCPFSAHIRKVNPRADLSETQDVNHHAMRASIAYGPEVTDTENETSITTEDRGLAFGRCSFGHRLVDIEVLTIVLA